MSSVDLLALLTGGKQSSKPAASRTTNTPVATEAKPVGSGAVPYFPTGNSVFEIEVPAPSPVIWAPGSNITMNGRTFSLNRTTYAGENMIHILDSRQTHYGSNAPDKGPPEEMDRTWYERSGDLRTEKDTADAVLLERLYRAFTKGAR